MKNKQKRLICYKHKIHAEFFHTLRFLWSVWSPHCMPAKKTGIFSKWSLLRSMCAPVLCFEISLEYSQNTSCRVTFGESQGSSCILRLRSQFCSFNTHRPSPVLEPHQVHHAVAISSAVFLGLVPLPGWEPFSPSCSLVIPLFSIHTDS